MKIDDTSADSCNILSLYRFLDAEAAIKTIEGKCLKVGRINDFNDPFEWRPAVGGFEEADELKAMTVMNDFRDHLNELFGIICMSYTTSDPVLWSHYADDHKGMAFELEYDNTDGRAMKVMYSNDRPMIDVKQGGDHDHVYKAIQKMLYQKSPGWSYEKEYRVHCDLALCNQLSGLYFTPIPENFLKRVILGYQCPHTVSDIEEALARAGFTDTIVKRASLAYSTYEVVC